MARPSPFVAPVTTAIFPLISNSSLNNSLFFILWLAFFTSGHPEKASFGPGFRYPDFTAYASGFKIALSSP
jgi:hypothetical protein